VPVIVGLLAGVGPAVTVAVAAPTAAKHTARRSAAFAAPDRTVALGRKAVQ